MAGKVFSSDLSNEMAVDPVLWGTAVMVELVVDPVGLAVRSATSLLLMAQKGSSDYPRSDRKWPGK